jgi:4'-phosphopantetheinyl transferase
MALPDPEIEVWLAPLDISAHQLEHCFGLLSPDEKTRVERMYFERDRRRSAVARALLRVLLAPHVGLKPAEIAFSLGPHGKPCIAAAPESLHFNVSHSEELAIYAISRNCALGIDIEYIARAIAHEGIAERFFSARENAELQRCAPTHRKRAFFACWTRKEAVVKATGDGLRLPLDQIEVTVSPDEQPRLISIPGGRTDDWTLHAVDVGSDYIATVAAHRAS